MKLKGEMTSQNLAEYIIDQRQEVENLPSLPDRIQADFDKQRFQEQVYHSSKLEGSSVRLSDIVDMA